MQPVNHPTANANATANSVISNAVIVTPTAHATSVAATSQATIAAANTSATAAAATTVATIAAPRAESNLVSAVGQSTIASAQVNSAAVAAAVQVNVPVLKTSATANSVNGTASVVSASAQAAIANVATQVSVATAQTHVEIPKFIIRARVVAPGTEVPPPQEEIKAKDEEKKKAEVAPPAKPEPIKAIGLPERWNNEDENHIRWIMDDIQLHTKDWGFPIDLRTDFGKMQAKDKLKIKATLDDNCVIYHPGNPPDQNSFLLKVKVLYEVEIKNKNGEWETVLGGPHRSSGISGEKWICTSVEVPKNRIDLAGTVLHTSNLKETDKAFEQVRTLAGGYKNIVVAAIDQDDPLHKYVEKQIPELVKLDFLSFKISIYEGYLATGGAQQGHFAHVIWQPNHKPFFLHQGDCNEVDTPDMEFPLERIGYVYSQFRNKKQFGDRVDLSKKSEVEKASEASLQEMFRRRSGIILAAEGETYSDPRQVINDRLSMDKNSFAAHLKTINEVEQKEYRNFLIQHSKELQKEIDKAGKSILKFNFDLTKTAFSDSKSFFVRRMIDLETAKKEFDVVVEQLEVMNLSDAVGIASVVDLAKLIKKTYGYETMISQCYDLFEKMTTYKIREDMANREKMAALVHDKVKEMSKEAEAVLDDVTATRDLVEQALDAYNDLKRLKVEVIDISDADAAKKKKDKIDACKVLFEKAVATSKERQERLLSQDAPLLKQLSVKFSDQVKEYDALVAKAKEVRGNTPRDHIEWTFQKNQLMDQQNKLDRLHLKSNEMFETINKLAAAPVA